MTTQTVVPFDFEGSQIRTLNQEGQAWLVLSDVCRVLDIENSRNASARLDADEKGVVSMDTLGGEQSVTVINESGLYSLILTSRKAAAKRFKKWVTAEVLPAIRKTGGYIVAAPDETPEELALRAMTVLQATVERQKLQLAAAMPKANGFDRIANADGYLTITEAAKALGMRPKDLFAQLQRMGWIYKRAGSKHWIGYQTRIQTGLLTHKVTTVQMSDGSERVVEHVLLTAKGMTHLSQMTLEGIN